VFVGDELMKMRNVLVVGKSQEPVTKLL